MAALALGSCIYLPAHIDEIPAGGGWMTLPLRGWIAEGEIKAEGIGACLAPDCAPRVGIAVFRATGAAARELATTLEDPQRLVRYLQERDAADTAAHRKAIRTVATARPFHEGRLSGFSITLMRADGSRPAHAVALGLPNGDTLRVALVIGESEDGVRLAAREVAARLR